jgi:hypothetical protein
MILDYSNRNSRFYKLLFYRSFGLIFFSIVLIGIISLALYFYKPDRSNGVIIANIVLLGLIWTLEYIRYYRFIFGFKKINKSSRLSINLDNMTIKSQSLKDNGLSELSKILKVTVHSHSRNELPFENPENISDKIENFLHSNMNNNKKYSNLWYLQIKTKDSKSYIITPLMIKKNEIPFKDFDIVYENNLYEGLSDFSD